MNALHGEQSHQERLQKLAVSDSTHDFDTHFTEIYKLLPQIGTPINKYQTPVRKGWDLIKEIANLGTLDKALPGTSGSFRTVTNMNYSYEVFDESAIEASVQYLYSGTPSKKANLIFDAFTGHWWKNILKSKGASELGTLRILTNRETVSDPASKPAPNDKAFSVEEAKKRSILIESYIDTTKEPITYPAWSLPRSDSRSDFFSNYSLELSDVNYAWEGEEVTLSFRHPEFETSVPLKTYGQGKTANSIQSLIPKLNQVAEAVKKGKLTPFQKHSYFTLLQQKRAGDSLQVLSSLDTTRRYDAIFEVGKTITDLDMTLTYVVTNDTFNTTPFGLLNGANIILLNGSSVYVFRRGVIRDPVDAFIEASSAEKTKLASEYMTAIQKHTEFFLLAKRELYEQILALMRQNSSELYNRPFIRAQIPSLESALNSAIRSILLYMYQLALFVGAYEPVFIEDIDLNNREGVSRFLNASQAQSLRQFKDGVDAREKLRSLAMDEAIQTISRLNFFTTKQGLQQAQYIKELRVIFGIIPAIAKKEATALLTLSTWLQSILETLFVSSIYSVSSQKQGFLVTASLLASVLPSSESLAGSKRGAEFEVLPVTKRQKIGGSSLLSQRSAPRSKTMSLASTLSAITATPLETSERTLLNYAFQIMREDMRPSEMVLPSASSALVKFVRANLQTPDDLWNLVLLRTIAFVNSIPLEREYTDDFRKWSIVFVELLEQIERTQTEYIKYAKVPAFLSLWTLPSEEIASILKLPESESWTAYGQEVGAVLLDYIKVVFDIVPLEGVFVAPKVSEVDNTDIFKRGQRLLDSMKIALPEERKSRSRKTRRKSRGSKTESKKAS